MSLLEQSGLSTFHVKDLITKKMEELKCPGDDEFAEYIIVMLHNNKSAGDVQAELEPFLGTQAAVFTPWAAESPPVKPEKRRKQRNYRKDKTKDEDFSDISDEESSSKHRGVSKYASVASSFIEAVESATLKVTAGKDSRKVEAKHQLEGIKLPLIFELGVDPVTCKPVIMSISPAIKLEDIPDMPERKHRLSHEWARVETGVVRNAVPNIDMPDFKREFVHATKVVASELSDNQSRVTIRCKFWPDCPNMKICKKHHPTEPCEKFPNCEAVLSCYKIHPLCKYNTACRVGQCKYTHTDTENRHIQMIIPCYYGKQCQNMEECPFLHWVGEIKPVTMKKKKSKKGKHKKHKKSRSADPLSPNAAAAAGKTLEQMQRRIRNLSREQLAPKKVVAEPYDKSHDKSHDKSRDPYHKAARDSSTYTRVTAWDSPEHENSDKGRWTP